MPTELPTDWLAAMPDLLARLESARHSRVADVGCGRGFSTLAIADALLDAHVDGFDVDAGSIADARAHAADAGLDGRVRYVCADAAGLAAHGPYDLVLLRAMSAPTAPLRAARVALSAGGAVVVVDERPSAAPGTAMRAGTVRRLADQAGYARVDVLALEHDVFRMYRLSP
jgi:predicted O-methyltransferase YrrM